jgi:hypothetical protein
MDESKLAPAGHKPCPPVEQCDEIELIVRTVNVHEADQRCPMDKDIMLPTLAGIAKRFHLDWSGQVGLIGITEPKRHIGAALYLPPTDSTYTSTRGLSAAIRHFFARPVSYYHNKRGGSSAKDIGIVHEWDWERLDAQSRRMGIAWAGNLPDFLGGGDVVDVPDTDINWTWARKLQMVLLRHRRTKLRLRFYCTHFSPGSDGEDKKKRSSQAARLVEKVQEWTSEADQLPPIVVGDFNARRVYGQPAEDSIEVLEKHFRRPLDDVAAQNNLTQTLIDIVWIGRKQSFPHITHDFQTLELRRIPMKDLAVDGYGRDYTPLLDDGFLKYPLTDHNYAEGFRLHVVPV